LMVDCDNMNKRQQGKVERTFFKGQERRNS
jgi:hypothetical protein